MKYFYEETADGMLVYAFVHSRLGLKSSDSINGRRYLDEESCQKLNDMNREQKFTMQMWRIWPSEEEE